MSRSITCETVSVLNENKIRNGDIIRLQIVRWNNGKPMLEKRKYWFNDDGEERPGKSKGLTAQDFDIILQNSDNIKYVLEAKSNG